jgi:hypothetical protein
MPDLPTLMLSGNSSRIHAGDAKRSSAARWWTAFLWSLRRLGSRRMLAVILFGMAGLVGSAAVGLARGVPIPRVHDEFAYLLAAETFAEGRLTNQTHPRWPHFESFHIIHQPSYQAKYPPGQGLLLALGIRAVGQPAAALWIGAGLLAAAFTWALLIWLPAAWGVTAAAYFLLHVVLASYWTQTYWGGTVAAIGGALTVGAYGLLRSNPMPKVGVLLGAGVSLLALSRPMEGLILASVFMIGVMRLLLNVPRRSRILLAQASGAALLIGVGTLGWTAYYNAAVTGSSLTMPYQVHEQQYAAAPSLLVSGAQAAAPEYRHTEIERYWMQWGKARHTAARERLPRHLAGALTSLLLFYLGVPVAALGGLLLNMRFPLRGGMLVGAALTGVLIATLMTKGAYPHYAAPAAVLFFILLGASLGSLHRHARRHRILNLAAVILAVGVLVTAVHLIQYIRSEPSAFAVVRHSMTRALEQLPGKHLVIVRYAGNHNFHQEWVYNAASIDAANVVWARAIDPETDAELLQYFSDRNAWHLLVGDSLTLQPISRTR